MAARYQTPRKLSNYQTCATKQKIVLNQDEAKEDGRREELQNGEGRDLQKKAEKQIVEQRKMVIVGGIVDLRSWNDLWTEVLNATLKPQG